MGSPTSDSTGAEPLRRPADVPSLRRQDRAPAYDKIGSPQFAALADARIAADAEPVADIASDFGTVADVPLILDSPPPSRTTTRRQARGDRPRPFRKHGDESEHRLGEAAARASPPWLVSCVVHLVTIILLALWMVGEDDNGPVRLEFSVVDTAGEFDDQPFSLGADDPQTDEQQVPPDDPFFVDDPFSDPPELEVAPEGLLASSPLDAPHVGLAFAGRDPGVKQALLQAYGGSGESESAVLRGLEWLARQQRGDGSWSLVRPYSDGGASENVASATAMAMLAFLGAGHTHQRGTFKDNVSRGLSFLLGLMDEDGNFFQGGRYTHWMYTQGQCTITLSELYGMTKDPALKKPAQMAVRFCERAQDRRLGGWRYQPGNDSDTSVTGWVVMALQSAKIAGLEVESKTLRRVDAYLDRVASRDGSQYSYRPGSAASVVMTAEALLCRQYLGWRHGDRRLTKGVELLLDNLPDWNDRNVYYWYYATQVMHHMEGQYWVAWNDAMRDLLVQRQVTSGREAGSWHPFAPQEDRWAAAGGRLYVTCLSLYILEVYYRHLPIYSQGALRAVVDEP